MSRPRQSHEARRAVPALIGMVHLPPLPGAPYASIDSLASTVAQAREEAQALERAGFPAVMVENFGDAPFYPSRVPRVTVAAMTRVLTDLASSVGIPLGVNVLRNDGESALEIAAITGATFVRINVLVGAMVTDQGVIEGRAFEVARLRAQLCPQVAVLADVMVKHAQPLGHLPDTKQLVQDTLLRAGADAVIVSGTGTGQPVDLDRLNQVQAAAAGAPVLIGSGADAHNIKMLVANGASGAIVGSSLKTNGRIDENKARQFVAAFSG